jgi:hypothetical protein
MASRSVPTSVRVFGITNMVFGMIGLLAGINSAVTGQAQEAYKVLNMPTGPVQQALAQMVISPIMSLVLLALVGIGLLMKQLWSRSASVYYSMFVIGFGILSLVVLNMPTRLMQLAQVQIVISPIMSLVLLALGIGLLMKQPWSRSASVYYSMFVIGFGILSLVATIAVIGGDMSNPMAIAAVVGGVGGFFLGAIYCGLMMYFLNKPEVKESIG